MGLCYHVAAQSSKGREPPLAVIYARLSHAVVPQPRALGVPAMLRPWAPRHHGAHTGNQTISGLR